MPVVDLAHPERLGKRERVREAGLVGFGRHHPNVVGKSAGDAFEHREAFGMDAVVIGQENAHGTFYDVNRLIDFFHTAHIGAENLRNCDAAVGVLVVFHHRDQRAADGDARTVQRMDEARAFCGSFPGPAEGR